MMNFVEIKHQFENSSALKLVRSDYGPLAINFFLDIFKKSNRLSIPLDELTRYLSNFLDDIIDLDDRYKNLTAEHLISMWSSEEHRFIKIYNIQESDIPITELSSDTEIVLEWFSDLQKNDFIGTESRLLGIFGGLKELVEKAEFAPKTRIKQLQQEKAAIEREIQEIKATGVAKRLSETQIRERLMNLIRDSRKLVSDFRQVEDNFKAIGKGLKERIYGESQEKATVLDYLFNCNDELENSDQGKSFRSFWEFLQSPSKQDELRELLSQVNKLPEVQMFLKDQTDHHYGTPLFKMKNMLLDAGKKVLDSTHQISEQLRRLLRQQKEGNDRRIREMIDQFKKVMINDKELISKKEVILELETTPLINLPLERPLWSFQEKTIFLNQALSDTEEIIDIEEIKELIPWHHIDQMELKRRIELLLQDLPQCTMPDIVNKFGMDRGINELICYLQIAHESATHYFVEDQYDIIEILSINDHLLKVKSPQVIFTRESI